MHALLVHRLFRVHPGNQDVLPVNKCGRWASKSVLLVSRAVLKGSKCNLQVSMVSLGNNVPQLRSILGSD
jgi:hypothetical protein